MRTYQIPSRAIYSLHDQFRAIDRQNRELLQLALNIHRSLTCVRSPSTTHHTPILGITEKQSFQADQRQTLGFYNTEQKLANFARTL